MEFTKEYFIAKFEAIPDELWTEGQLKHITGDDITKCCAAGFCGVMPDEPLTEECLALGRFLYPFNLSAVDEFQAIYYINDGVDKNKKLGSTPKERILNALKSLV